MAIWQATFSLEPDLRALPVDYREQLDRLLPRGRVWSSEQEAWGAEAGHRVDVWHDPRGATEVRLRIDLRALDAAWLEKALHVVQGLRRTLQTPDGRAVETNLGDLMLVLRGSPAWRFVEDPQDFLNRVARGDWQDG